ncbi:EAL domain-containing protein [Hungatella effluvii]|uniref:EAL domain-containing protein n=1 Tax=Hungatella effluvii TaxID=1096246 RepID=UPI003D80FBE2
MSTIAEGVETREQYEYLKAHGCDVIQGYYFGRPMTAESFEMLLSSQTAGR